MAKKSRWFRERRRSSPRSSNRDDNDNGDETKKKGIYHGWRASVTVCSATAGTILSINAMLTIWASVRYRNSGGLATIQEGSCQNTKTLSLWLHLAINILSTILLSASNYCMQCLSSPTREEVDRAHRKQIWLDIGVPSVRNLHQISWYRIALWWALALSGIPLHLLYNSAVFSSLATTEYTVFAASPNLFTDRSVDWSQSIYGDYSGGDLQHIRNAKNWQRLENKACIEAYGQEFVSAYGDLVAISTNLNATNPAVAINKVEITSTGFSGVGTPYEWICWSTQTTGSQQNCDIGRLISQPKPWKLIDHPRMSDGSGDGRSALPELSIDYCLSDPVEERCRLQFSLVIMGIVIGCNVVKTICMVLTLWYHRSQPLVTLGDALASFLDHPDPTTENMCLANKSSFAQNKSGDTLQAEPRLRDPNEGDRSTCLHLTNDKNGRQPSTYNTLETETEYTKKWVPGAKRWQTQSYRWFNSASVRR